MGRMLDALKTLDSRTQEPAEPREIQRTAKAKPRSAELVLKETADLVEQAAEMFGPPAPAIRPEPAPTPVAPPALPRAVALPTAPFETCRLPTVDRPADYYLEMAARICDQGAGNYSNVLLFVASDRRLDLRFSMTELAQSFAVQLASDVLLVDGELREGKLSQCASRTGPGMVEAMLGQAQWTDIIHPTNVPRIDFVARGRGQVPTFERPQFGWGALRPLYRAVLIGLANQAEPETNWLAARCDAIYYVLSRQNTRRSSASAAVNALRSSGANVAGTIVVDD